MARSAGGVCYHPRRTSSSSPARNRVTKQSIFCICFRLPRFARNGGEKKKNPSVPAGHLPLPVEALKRRSAPLKPLLQGEVARSAGGVCYHPRRTSSSSPARNEETKQSNFCICFRLPRFARNDDKSTRNNKVCFFYIIFCGVYPPFLRLWRFGDIRSYYLSFP